MIYVSTAIKEERSLPPSIILMPPNNPDKRPLPDGWVEEYDEKRKRWYYRHLSPHRISYSHPFGKPPPTSARDLLPDTDPTQPDAGASSYGETLYQLAKSSIAQTGESSTKRTSVRATSTTTRSPSIHSVEAVIQSSPPPSARSFSSLSSESSMAATSSQRSLYTSAQPQAASSPPQYSPTDFKTPLTHNPVSLPPPSQVYEPLNPQPGTSYSGPPSSMQHGDSYGSNASRKVHLPGEYTSSYYNSGTTAMGTNLTQNNEGRNSSPTASQTNAGYTPVQYTIPGSAYNVPHTTNNSQPNTGYTPGVTNVQPAQGPTNASSHIQGGYTPVQYGIPNTSNKPPANHNRNSSQGGYTPVQYGVTNSQPAQGPTNASHIQYSTPSPSQGGYTPVQYGIADTSNKLPANHNRNSSQGGYTPVQYSGIHWQPAHGATNGYSPTHYGISSSNQGGYAPVQYGQNQNTFSNLSPSYGGSVHPPATGLGPPSVNNNAIIPPPNTGYTSAHGGSVPGFTHNVNLNVQPSSNNAGHAPGEAASYYGGYVPPSNPIFNYSSQYVNGNPQTGSIPVQYGGASLGSQGSGNPQGNAGNSKPSTGNTLLGALKFGYKVYEQINNNNSQASSNSNPGIDLNSFNVIDPDNNSGGGDNNYVDQLNQLSNALNGMTMSSDGNGGDSGNLAMQMDINSMGDFGNVDTNFNVNVDFSGTDSGNF